MLHFVNTIRDGTISVGARMGSRREAIFARLHHINVSAGRIVLHGLLSANIVISVIGDIEAGDAATLHVTHVNIELDVATFEPGSERIVHAVPILVLQQHVVIVV